MSTTKQRELPTFAELAPRWADLTMKLLHLSRQEEELLAEMEALPPFIMPAAVPQMKSPPPRHKPLSPAAKAALGDLEIPPAPLPEYRAPDPATESLLAMPDSASQRAADLNVQLYGVREAIAVIHAELPRALAEGSRAYCDAVCDQYSEHASNMCAALVALARAYVDHQDFLAQVQAAGVNTAFLAPLNLESTDLPRVMGDVRSGDSGVFTVLARGRGRPLCRPGGSGGGIAQACSPICACAICRGRSGPASGAEGTHRRPARACDRVSMEWA